MMRRKIIYIGLMGVLVLFMSGTVFTATEGKDKQKADTSSAVSLDEETVVSTKSGEVQGEISTLGKNYISLIYNRDSAKSVEYEMMLPLDENVTFEFKKGLQDFSVGDTIKVKFEDTTSEKADVEKVKRKAKVISFVGPEAKKPPTLTPPEPGDGIADDVIFQKEKK